VHVPLALHLWPEAPNHKNNTLRYWRKLQVRTHGIAPHRALGDALVTSALLHDELLELRKVNSYGTLNDIDKLIAFSERPALMLRMPFGKHRKAVFSDPKAMPTSYMEWALGNLEDLSRDLRFTMETELCRRGELRKAS